MATLSDAEPAPSKAGVPLRVSRLSDELLARQAARGSSRAFQAIYERYHQPLYQYTRSIVRHDQDAQDALQSTFTKALSALARRQRNAPLRPWLYRIAHNEAISVIRARRRDQSTEVGEGVQLTAPSAEEEVGARERWSTLMGDLAELPERQRGALLLRELGGLGHDEIALTLGTTTSGAKQSIFEARQTLAEFAEGREMGCDEVSRRISDGDGRALRSRRVRAHLRGCGACSVFAAAIPARQSELRAMAPVLPSTAAAALLARSLHAAGHAAGGAGTATSSVVTAGIAGKAAGGALVWKAAAGLAVVATAAAGVAGIRAAAGAHHHAGGRTLSRPHAVTTGQTHRAAAARRVAAQRAVAGDHHARGVSHRHAAATSAPAAAAFAKAGKHLGAANRRGNSGIFSTSAPTAHPVPASHTHHANSGTRTRGHPTPAKAKKHPTPTQRHGHGNSRGRSTLPLNVVTNHRGTAQTVVPHTGVSAH